MAEFNNSERDKQESGGWWGAISGLASSAQQYAEVWLNVELFIDMLHFLMSFYLLCRN